MEAKWTLKMAREVMEQKAATLTAADFTDSVLLVTPDSVQHFNGAIAERVGPYYLVFTEHHGHFLEHEDEVLRCDVMAWVDHGVPTHEP